MHQDELQLAIASPELGLALPSDKIQHKGDDVTNRVAYLQRSARDLMRQYQWQSALSQLSEAVTLVRETGNALEEALIGHDLSICHMALKSYTKAQRTIEMFNQKFQELDLVDQKVMSLIALADFYRCIGNKDLCTKKLNLAQSLFTHFSACENYRDKMSHVRPLKLSLVAFELKFGNPSKALEGCQQLLNIISSETKDSDNVDPSLLQTLLTQQLCHTLLHQREKSAQGLQSLKRMAEQMNDMIFAAKVRMLKFAHETFFEPRERQKDEYASHAELVFEAGFHEFVLDVTRIIVKHLSDKKQIHLNRGLSDFYRHIYHDLLPHIPAELNAVYKAHYEWVDTMQSQVLVQTHSRQFVDFCRTLMGENDIKALSQKALQLIMSYIKVDQGTLLIFDAMKPVVAATNISEDITDYKDQIGLIKSVLNSKHPFILCKNHVQDHFDLRTSHAEELQKFSGGSVFVYPLLVNGDGIGVVYLSSHQADCEIDLEIESEMIENLMSMLATAINSAYRHKFQAQDIKQAKKIVDSHQHDIKIEKYSLQNFLGLSPKKRELIQIIQKTLDNNATITLTGESGVGKEMIARMIHYNGPRQYKKFVAINCAAIPENLLESELFGHVRGAFTGANDNRDGLFVVAHGGTIFLDEIGEMPMSMQVKIIRVLQEREVVPVGGTEAKKVDVRVICATHRNLEEMVKQGAFREDLYFRLHVVNIHVPPLRERIEDIPLLCDHALNNYALENQVTQKVLSNQALDYLMKYSWPGNVRELVNVMYNLSIFVDKPTIEVADLEERHDLFRVPISKTESAPVSSTGESCDLNNLNHRIDKQEITLSEAKQEFERLQIERALKIYNGQITSASYHLQMPRPQVSRLVKKYGLKEQDG